VNHCSLIAIRVKTKTYWARIMNTHDLLVLVLLLTPILLSVLIMVLQRVVDWFKVNLVHTSEHKFAYNTALIR